ncbi:MAG: hypothetical protein IPK15_17295 [Verrucomicrobia bacterium]|nr:hypothetical protein [Verrucomicrobiota bacterium]
MTWEFTASSIKELSNIRQSLPETAKPTVAGELVQMTQLIAALARTEVFRFPFRACHTGEQGVPDFRLESGTRRIGVEMAKVTSRNLEHARSLQAKLPDPPSHFASSSLCHPESFARKLKEGRDAWSKFVASQLPQHCREWNAAWNGNDKVSDDVKADLVLVLNSIVDGPPIADDPELTRAFPQPVVIKVEGFPCGETCRDRKSWLEDAFWESLAVPLNPTLMVSPFIQEDDTAMSRNEVMNAAFVLPALGIGGPTVEEERQVWVQRVCSEVEDKGGKLMAGKFAHADEYWLVLWDRMGTPEWELPSRVRAVSQRLASCWKPGWFSRVFIHDEHFEWQVMFTAAGSSNLANCIGGAF